MITICWLWLGVSSGFAGGDGSGPASLPFLTQCWPKRPIAVERLSQRYTESWHGGRHATGPLAAHPPAWVLRLLVSSGGRADPLKIVGGFGGEQTGRRWRAPGGDGIRSITIRRWPATSRRDQWLRAGQARARLLHRLDPAVGVARCSSPDFSARFSILVGGHHGAGAGGEAGALLPWRMEMVRGELEVVERARRQEE